MDVGQNIEELRGAGDYHLLRKKLKGGGIGSIFFGVVAIGMGIAFMEESPVNMILVLIGVSLLIEGIWIIRAPSPKGMIIDGIAMCIIGIWNIVVGIAGAARWAVILGLFQIYWGVKSFGQYQRFSYLSSRKPSEQNMGQVEDIIKSVTKAKASESENIIELQMDNKQWKGELTRDVAVFVTAADDDVIFARRSEVDFTPKGEVVPGKKRERFIKMGGRSFAVKISPELMERYESWKGA